MSTRAPLVLALAILTAVAGAVLAPLLVDAPPGAPDAVAQQGICVPDAARADSGDLAMAPAIATAVPAAAAPRSPDDAGAQTEAHDHALVAVRGTVLAAATFAPVADAEVWSEHAGSCCSLHARTVAHTDRAGHFVLALPPGDHVLVARATGCCAGASPAVTVGTTPLDLAQPILVAAHRIATRAVTAAGAPIGGAPCTLRRLGAAVPGGADDLHSRDDLSGSSATTTTDAAGQVRFAAAPGVYLLTVAPADRPGGSWSLRVDADGGSTLPAQLTVAEPCRLVLALRAPRRGDVLETTDALGRVDRRPVAARLRIDGLAPGAVTIALRAAGGQTRGTWRATLTPERDCELDLDDAVRTVPGRVDTGESGTLRIASASGAREFAAEVDVVDGVFAVALPDGGAFCWRFRAADGTNCAGTLALTDGEVVLHVPSARLTVTVRDADGAACPCSLRLLARDPTGGESVAVPASDATATDADGRVAFRRLRGGSYRIEAFRGDRVLALDDALVDLPDGAHVARLVCGEPPAAR